MPMVLMNTIAGRCDRLEALLERERSTPIDAVLLLGNLFSGRASESIRAKDPLPQPPPIAAARMYEEATMIFDLLGAFNAPVYLIPGESDPSIMALCQMIQVYPGTTRVELVHRTVAQLGATDIIVGFGGRLTTTPEIVASIQFPTWEARIAFEHVSAYNTAFKTARRRIFLFGSPPYGTQLDRLNGTHIGARLLNDLILGHQPHLVCCGGPASGRGVEIMDGTRVVNPGALVDGSYAVIDLDRNKIRLGQLPMSIDNAQVSLSALSGDELDSGRVSAA